MTNIIDVFKVQKSEKKRTIILVSVAKSIKHLIPIEEETIHGIFQYLTHSHRNT